MDVLEKEFDLFYSLSFVSDNSDIISDIDNLCLEEEKCIDFLPKSISSLDSLNNMIHNFYKGDFSLKRYFVLLRLDNIFESLKAEIENGYLDETFLDEFYDGYGVYNYVRIKFLSNFIKEDDNFGYLAAFSNKEVSDKLISNNFDLHFLDFDEANSTYDNNPDFLDFYDEQLYLEACNVLAAALGSSEFEMSDVIFDYNYSLFRSLLMNMSEDNFNLIRDDFINSDFYSDNDNYERFSSIFDEIYKKRFSFENNASVSNLNIDNFDSLVNLIKLEETIYNKYTTLDLFNEESVRIFLNLMFYESEVICSINIDEYDVDSLFDVIDKDISFFISDDKIGNLIGNRIKNLLPVFRCCNYNCISKTYPLIIRNHMINSLDGYKDVICNIPCDSDVYDYITVYKNVIFEYPDLLNDILIMNLDFSILFPLDDNMSSKFLGISNDLNYSYDKDELLYDLGLSLIDEINDLSDNVNLIALYKFKICEFNDIINNVSVEHLYSLLDKVQNLNSSKAKRKLLGSFNFSYEY